MQNVNSIRKFIQALYISVLLLFSVFFISCRPIGLIIEDPTFFHPSTLSWYVAPNSPDPGFASMVAESAICSGGNIEYYFLCTSHPDLSSGWQPQQFYELSGLNQGEMYSFRVKARSGADNETKYSEERSVAITAPVPIVPDTTKWVNGYYVGYHTSLMSPEEIGWHGLTHISIGALLVTDDSEDDHIDPVLNTTFFKGSNAEGTALATKVATLAKENDVIPLIMLGGAGFDEPIRNATSPETISVFVDELLDFLDTTGALGYDLDWEGGAVDFDRLITLAAMLKGRDPAIILTYPTGNYNPNYMGPGNSDYENFMTINSLAHYVDQINIMSYWGCGTTWYGAGWYSGHCSALYPDTNNPVSIQTTLDFLHNTVGIEKSKLGMGIGFYAGSYSDGISETGQAVIGPYTMRGGDNAYRLSKLFISPSYTYAQANGIIQWDSDARCSYISLPEGMVNEFDSRYITYESERSILEKGKFCRDNDYGGIIIWTIDQGYTPEHQNPHFLMDVMRKAFIEPDTYDLTPAISIMPQNISISPDASRQLYTLVTGTDSDSYSINWNLSGGGSINATGKSAEFTAGSLNGVYDLQASVPGSDTASGTIYIDDTEWTPSLYLFNYQSWWKELMLPVDAGADSVYMIYDKCIIDMSYRFTREADEDEPGYYFRNMTHVPENHEIRFFTVNNTTGKIAITDWHTYVPKGETFSLYDNGELHEWSIEMPTYNVDEIIPDMLISPRELNDPEKFNPKLYLFCELAAWKELMVARIFRPSSAYMIYDGEIIEMYGNGTNFYNSIHGYFFKNLTQVPDGSWVRFYTTNLSGEMAITDWVRYNVHSSQYFLFNDDHMLNSETTVMETTNITAITSDMLVAPE